ncbi:unnamed protein product [Caenorhabditis sp. 36 PRJEB53466]|nr:unnamed protein product [Caenorhabditis sp. 36 PRJEB53466]
MSSKTVLHLLIGLSKHSAPSPTTFGDVLVCMTTAFKQHKPLFEENDRLLATESISKSLPLICSAIRQLDIGMNIDRRQDAQMVISGIRYIADEMPTEVGVALEELISSKHTQSILDYIQNTEGVEPENVTWSHVDISKVPRAHYWWFDSDE